MQVETTSIPDLLVIIPKIFRDERGWFVESYHRERFLEAGISVEFVQDNHSRSSRGSLRGLHYQRSPGQAKLVRCTQGEIWDVAVDIRPESATFGKWEGRRLNAETAEQLFIPVGFAHGFVVLSEWAELQYKCSWYYDPKTESGISWNDPDLAVKWPLGSLKPVLSARDRNNPGFREVFPLRA